MSVGRPRLSAAVEESFRQRAVEVARDLFATEGYGSVSMRRVAAGAGCAPATLYRYFSSKWELLRFVWQEILYAALDDCARAVEGVSGAAPRLRTFLSAYGRYWLAHPEHYVLIFTLQDRLLGRDDRYFVEWPGVARALEDYVAMVRACMESGLFAGRDPEVVAHALFCGVQGLVGTTITIPEMPWQSQTEILTCGLDLLLDG